MSFELSNLPFGEANQKKMRGGGKNKRIGIIYIPLNYYYWESRTEKNKN